VLRLQSGKIVALTWLFRARPMRTSSQFAPQTRELPRTTIRSSTSPCRFSLSKEGVELCADNTGERGDCRNFGTSITCRDKATCPVETQGRSTYNAMGKTFSEDRT